MRLEKTPRPGPDLGAGGLIHSRLLPHAHGGPSPTPFLLLLLPGRSQ